MKNKFLWLFILLFPVLVFAQENTEERLSADFGVGREFNFKNTSINFIRVVSDSRCPKQVTCIWPGEARVLLGIELNGEYFEKEVVVSGSGAEIMLANELLMQVSHLRPYPETGVKIAPEDYNLRISAIFSAED